MKGNRGEGASKGDGDKVEGDERERGRQVEVPKNGGLDGGEVARAGVLSGLNASQEDDLIIASGS